MWGTDSPKGVADRAETADRGPAPSLGRRQLVVGSTGLVGRLVPVWGAATSAPAPTGVSWDDLITSLHFGSLISERRRQQYLPWWKLLAGNKNAA